VIGIQVDRKADINAKNHAPVPRSPLDMAKARLDKDCGITSQLIPEQESHAFADKLEYGYVSFLYICIMLMNHLRTFLDFQSMSYLRISTGAPVAPCAVRPLPVEPSASSEHVING